MEKLGIVKKIITQNVDDLHERAGSKNVLHLHGKLRDIICSSSLCSYSTQNIDFIDSIPEKLPECPECGSLLRPGVVWFGESLNPEVLTSAFGEAEKSDLILVVGTSAVVQPAASIPLITKRRGGKIIEINPNETPLSYESDLSIRNSAAILQEILLHLKK
jgi:NAD-dependent deacetylase